MKSIKKINKIANKILRNTSLKFEEILKNLTFKCTLLSIFKIEKKNQSFSSIFAQNSISSVRIRIISILAILRNNRPREFHPNPSQAYIELPGPGVSRPYFPRFLPLYNIFRMFFSVLSVFWHGWSSHFWTLTRPVLFVFFGTWD